MRILYTYTRDFLVTFFFFYKNVQPEKDQNLRWCKEATLEAVDQAEEGHQAE